MPVAPERASDDPRSILPAPRHIRTNTSRSHTHSQIPKHDFLIRPHSDGSDVCAALAPLCPSRFAAVDSAHAAFDPATNELDFIGTERLRGIDRRHARAKPPRAVRK